ncbi:TerB family tellurite resistance protein [Shewanella sp. D64]|uniref:tellurite resistance TerB family protein n=1 Tax=unclassified Shewanella TaxID=196818 RepID=UPI0022BA4381|nr:MULTISPECIES: TerB family tellurite resistance protein [unclassified Shewanella]MEC4728653.1 TerB family tellurite resistance protein [Shewanella sp. D64]MEC4740584.1 TerB family tellurite resistance protein [Shewanella sp. E94]WBJ95108.1 TerB family tellurite resistance protein [Shewanella sp. MTB7]
MIAKLKKFLTSHAQAVTPEEQAHHLNLAAVSLLLEVVFADETLSDEEANLLPSMLAEALSLVPSEVEELVKEATEMQKNSTSLYEFTSEINQNCSVEQKQKLILSMWKLAYADGQLCQYEDQIIRRTADLLYLKHSELIQMRNIAMENR